MGNLGERLKMVKKKFEQPEIIFQKISTAPEIGQCDACASVIPSKANYNLVTSRNKFTLPAFIEQPVDDSRTIVISPISNFFSVLNKSAMNILRKFKNSLCFDEIISEFSQIYGYRNSKNLINFLVTIDLLSHEKDRLLSWNESNQTLCSWIQVTNRCNLRCSYCYAKKGNNQISPLIGKKIIDTIFNAAKLHGYKNIKIKYSGGEPLLSFNEIVILHKHAIELSKKNRIKLDGIILTNGTTINKEIISAIKQFNLRCIISLDGINQYNDSQRLHVDKSSSFSIINENIKMLMSSNISPNISITVTQKNIFGLPKFVDWLINNNLYFNINFYRKNENAKNDKDLHLKQDVLIQKLLDTYSIIESNMPSWPLLSSLANRTNLGVPHIRTCSMGHSYLVFDCYGNIYKCQMRMDKQISNIYENDPLSKIRNDTEGLQNVKVDDKHECSSCLWKYRCGGGCSFSNFRRTGKYNSKSIYCNVYKELFPAIIRMEALRVLQQKDLNSIELGSKNQWADLTIEQDQVYFATLRKHSRSPQHQQDKDQTHCEQPFRH